MFSSLNVYYQYKMQASGIRLHWIFGFSCVPNLWTILNILMITLFSICLLHTYFRTCQRSRPRKSWIKNCRYRNLTGQSLPMPGRLMKVIGFGFCSALSGSRTFFGRLRLVSSGSKSTVTITIFTRHLLQNLITDKYRQK